MIDKEHEDILTMMAFADIDSDVEPKAALKAIERINELEEFIKSNCYDMPGQPSVRAKEILNPNS